MLSAIVERHIALHHATGHLFRKQSILLRDYARFAKLPAPRSTPVEWSRCPSRQALPSHAAAA